MSLAGKRPQAAYGSFFLPCAAGEGDRAKRGGGGSPAGSPNETCARWMTQSRRAKGGENRGRGPFHRAWRGPPPPPRGGGWRALLLAALLAVAPPAFAKPQRVVSLNLCADELALRLADPGVVKSVTWLSQDSRNANMAAKAAALPANDGHVEEALAYDPDLVLVGPFADPASIALLKQVGAPVVEVGAPQTFDGVRRQIRDLAAALGEPQRGAALIADMDARLARVVVDPRRPRLKAVVLRPNGFTVGSGSLVDEILSRAGLDNLAAHLDIAADEQVPLEVLALLGADLLILDRDGSIAPSLADAVLDHPAIAALARRMTVVSLPSRLWTCGGPEIAEAVERLAAAAAARAQAATQ